MKRFLFFAVWGMILCAKSVLAQEAGDLGKVVVTASRMAQHDYQIAGNVSVITQKEIAASNAQNITDILKQNIGINIYDNSTVKSAVLDIRGFGDTATRNVLVLVNDHKINNMDMSGPDLARIPLESVERIEIIRGAGSVLYGDNAVGGVVNIITKQGHGPLTARAGAARGSYGTSSTDAEVSGSEHFAKWGKGHDVSYFFYSKYYDSNGYRVNSGLVAKDFDTRLGYKLSDKVSLDFNAGWHKDDQRLPGGLSALELETLGRQGSSNPDDFTSTKDRYVQLSFDVKPWPEDIDYGRGVVDFSYRNRDAYDAFFKFGEFSTKRSIDAMGVTTKYIFDRTLFGRNVNFVTGLDFNQNENDILGSGGNADDLTISKDERAAFGYLEYELFDKLFVNSGTRFQEAAYTFTQRNVVVNEKQKPHQWVSMGGMKYEYAPGSNIHMNVQQTFRFLTTDEWYSSANYPSWGITPGLNTSLKQQEGTQYEVGIKHNIKDVTTLTLTPYWMDAKNEIFLDPQTGNNDNYPKTRRVGVEFGEELNLKKWLELKSLDRLTVFANYTYQDPEFVDGDKNNKKIPFVPQHQTNQGVTVGFGGHYQVSLVGRYVGSRFAINDTLNETSPVKPYYVVDTKLSYQQKNWDLYLDLNNIFNEKYYSYVSKSTVSTAKSYFPAPGFNFMAGMDVKF